MPVAVVILLTNCWRLSPPAIYHHPAKHYGKTLDVVLCVLKAATKLSYEIICMLNIIAHVMIFGWLPTRITAAFQRGTTSQGIWVLVRSSSSLPRSSV